MAETFTLVTDGACSGNGTEAARGGWAAIVTAPDGEETVLTGGEFPTTNNRMELTAVIRALEALKRPSRVRLYTDSLYVQKGISQWIHDWKRRGWRTADNKPVKNEDLWRELDEAASRHDVAWHWVKGHADDPTNIRVDELAVAAMKPFKRQGQRASV